MDFTVIGELMRVQDKLEFKDIQKGVDELVYRYIEGLQWVMYYYYRGVASWGWFYDYHYAPRISGMFSFPFHYVDH
jgi:5'-3' exoribonuclease 1